MRRRHIGLKTKLAATLLMMRDKLGFSYITYNDAKMMTEDEVIAKFHFDHGILHAIDPIDEFWNLTPRLIAEHREKSRKDIAIVAKVKRLEKARMELTRPSRIGRRWPSRPFPKRGSKRR
jgi:hypothetical protein